MKFVYKYPIHLVASSFSLFPHWNWLKRLWHGKDVEKRERETRKITCLHQFSLLQQFSRTFSLHTLRRYLSKYKALIIAESHQVYATNAFTCGLFSIFWLFFFCILGKMEVWICTLRYVGCLFRKGIDLAFLELKFFDGNISC